MCVGGVRLLCCLFAASLSTYKNQVTGALKIGQFAGKDMRGKVFSGGSCEVFNSLMGVRNKVRD